MTLNFSSRISRHIVYRVWLWEFWALPIEKACLSIIYWNLCKSIISPAGNEGDWIPPTRRFKLPIKLPSFFNVVCWGGLDKVLNCLPWRLFLRGGGIGAGFCSPLGGKGGWISRFLIGSVIFYYRNTYYLEWYRTSLWRWKSTQGDKKYKTKIISSNLSDVWLPFRMPMIH